MAGLTSKITNKYGDVLMKYGICISDKYTEKIDAWSQTTGLARAKIIQKIVENYMDNHEEYEF